jgi:hypothetical protein
MLALGAAGTAYQAVMLRIYPILVDSGAIARHEWISPDRQVGKRAMATRQAYTKLRSILPQDTVLQFNPLNDIAGYMYGSYAGWQTTAFDPSCGSVFGGNRGDCDRLLPEILRIFRSPRQDAPAVKRSPSAVVFQDTDPIWLDRQSWLWNAKPIVTNEFIRIVPTQGNAQEPQSSAEQAAHVDE